VKTGDVYGGWELLSARPLPGRHPRVFRFRCRRCETTVSKKTLGHASASACCMQCSHLSKQKRPRSKICGGYRLLSTVPVGGMGGQMVYRMECRRCERPAIRSLSNARSVDGCRKCRPRRPPVKLGGRLGLFTLVSAKRQKSKYAADVPTWLWKCKQGHVSTRTAQDARFRQCLPCKAGLVHGTWVRADLKVHGRSRDGRPLYNWKCVQCGHTSIMQRSSVVSRRAVARSTGGCSQCGERGRQFDLLGRGLSVKEIVRLFPHITEAAFRSRVRNGLSVEQAALRPNRLKRKGRLGA
jgi:hypothetical protein